MTGLEKIMQEIKDEAQREAADIIKAAEAQGADILAEAKAASDTEVTAVAQDADKKVADVERGRESALQLQRRQHLLQTKQELLAETLQKALQALYALPDGEYFSLLVRLAAKHAAPGKGEMLLNEKDLARKPAGFDAQLAAALPGGSELVVSAKTRPVDGGFVLKYGDVEVNCSFKAMFDADSEEMADSIRGILFAEGA